MTAHPIAIRRARPEDYQELGRLLVASYSALPGMPSVDAQPQYYARLADVAVRAATPGIQVLVATAADGGVLGGVDFIEDMSQYGTGCAADGVADAAGIRLLVVDPRARGAGIGRTLTGHCIERARALGKARVILHTTKAMATAWRLYEALGFARREELDFLQKDLRVYGFELGVGVV